MTDATGNDKRRKSPAAHDVVRKVSAGRSGMAATLVAAAAAFAAFADDSAWVYDTSKRVEPQVCRVASSSRALDGQSLAADREERQRNLLAATAFPQRFEVDYVRVWAPESDARASETNLVSRSSPGNPK